MVHLNHHLRQNCSIFMRNFKQNQHKLSNNHVQFLNLNVLCKFEPPSKKSWMRPCFYYLFYFIYMGQPIWDPYGTQLHCPYGSYMGAHMGPIWVPYRLLAGLIPLKRGTSFLIIKLKIGPSFESWADLARANFMWAELAWAELVLVPSCPAPVLTCTFSKSVKIDTFRRWGMKPPTPNPEPPTPEPLTEITE